MGLAAWSSVDISFRLLCVSAARMTLIYMVTLTYILLINPSPEGVPGTNVL